MKERKGQLRDGKDSDWTLRKCRGKRDTLGGPQGTRNGRRRIGCRRANLQKSQSFTNETFLFIAVPFVPDFSSEISGAR
ncbi:unnamed protein product [Caenorhabditis auriculariae]|uniref:Uncharacterized protein n=1 Tax=Caenorhabditis auriculariae TaxID=2777116 RepID=A0A8S1GYN1_9PELO|nr:unnamed protein product [Caenorhabditis auriculariae]